MDFSNFLANFGFSINNLRCGVNLLFGWRVEWLVGSLIS